MISILNSHHNHMNTYPADPSCVDMTCTRNTILDFFRIVTPSLATQSAARRESTPLKNSAIFHAYRIMLICANLMQNA